MQFPSKRKHRVILYVTCYNVLDGVTLTLRKIEQELLAQGHSVCIVSTNSGNSQNTHMHLEDQQYQRYRHLATRHPNRTVIFLDNSLPIPFLHDPNNPKDSYQLGFSISTEVREKLDDFRPTIVHITVPDVTCMHLIQYARDRQLPLMGTYHSNIPDYFTHYRGIGWMKHIIAGYERHNYNFLQALYVPTPFIRKHLSEKDHYRFDKVTNLKVWGRGVDLDRFHPSNRSEDFRARHGFSSDDVVVTWVGRLVPEKRPDIFASVVRRLADEGVDFKALVVGAGPCESEIKTLPNTTFVGWMTGDELSVAYASSDVFVFPSAVETFGNVTLEAAASGLPLVVDSGCSGHLVQHGVSGFACEEGDAEAYYNGTLSLVLDHSRRKAMSKEGRHLSLRYEKRAVCRKMIDNYSKTTKEFYGLYNGNHANRDREYENKPESFLGGSYVRPTGLMMVENIFIFIFCVVYRVAEMLFNARRCIASIKSACHSTTAPEAMARTKKSMPLVTSSSANTASESTESSINSDAAISSGIPLYNQNAIENQAAATLNYVSEIEEPTDGGDMDSIDGNSTFSCDDTASSTSSSASSDTQKRVYEDRFWRSDLPFSHNLAILLVKCVRTQGRVESCLRKRWTRRTLASASNDWLVTRNTTKYRTKFRKRKTSEDLSPDDLEGSNMIALQLKESLLPVGSYCSSTDSCEGSDHSLVEDFDASIASTKAFISRTYNEHGLNSRRVKSSSNLQV